METVVLVESKSARDSHLSAISHARAEELLTKVKGLMFAVHQGTGIATTEQMAEFFEVTPEVVRDNLRRHSAEFKSDGVDTLRNKALKEVREILSLSPNCPNLTVWTPRAALRLGMVLRDSEVAEQVRTALLNMVETVTPVVRNESVLVANARAALELAEKYEAQQIEIERVKALQQEQSKRIDQIEADRAIAREALRALPPSGVNVPPESLDMKVRRVVNDYCLETGSDRQTVWRNLYQQHFYRFRRKVSPLEGESKLQAFVRLGLVESLYGLAVELLTPQTTRN